jgi:hypothetical protein
MPHAHTRARTRAQPLPRRVGLVMESQILNPTYNPHSPCSGKALTHTRARTHTQPRRVGLVMESQMKSVRRLRFLVWQLGAFLLVFSTAGYVILKVCNARARARANIDAEIMFSTVSYAILKAPP